MTMPAIGISPTEAQRVVALGHAVGVVLAMAESGDTLTDPLQAKDVVLRLAEEFELYLTMGVHRPKKTVRGEAQ